MGENNIVFDKYSFSSKTNKTLNERKKRMFVRYDGYKIYPESIEKVICENSFVKSCAVVPCNTASIGILPLAYVQKVPSSEVTEKQLANVLIQSCKQKLAERMIPSNIVFIDDIPLTHLGKVDYRALEQLTQNM